MTRDEVLAQYEVSESGKIQTPGKFEDQMLYVPHFWERHEQGLDDGSDDGVHIFFTILSEEFREFPELRGKSEVVLYETDEGLVREWRDDEPASS